MPVDLRLRNRSEGGAPQSAHAIQHSVAVLDDATAGLLINEV